ncbi:galactose mutarotase-like domain-containing protein [Fusarium sp. MPI-SDFR-AT-0072]|uniref:Aldose 1-epimerase n=1 Tax=Fusarium oxysporum (strain Fo5176) TaxID=660025 RepID=F9FYK6_FUSOF|nr:hypothetical protein FOXB_11488 [Fusarium oxysporum f. sp. conglutinans Fo5176]KAH7177541.1 galactose mutarotase-like domain-containing protein [Fusarium sp. MPI-SDFR-AT-0072]
MADAPISFLPLGAIIQSLVVNGVNIVQGFPTQEDYEKHNSPYFGVTVGRVANRIKGARIDSLNGKEVTLAANDGQNHLHGGKIGWSSRVWDGPKPVGTRQVPGVEGLEGGESVAFTLTSEDGDEGYPGTVEVTVTYTTGTQNVDGKEVIILAMEYEAKLVGGADETVINMTNHSYFNPSGKETIAGTDITLPTANYLAVGSDLIPTGKIEPFPGVTANKTFTLGPQEPNIDHCFVLNTDPSSVPLDTRNQPLNLNIYTGAGINVPAVNGLPARGARAGFCCEPARYVNAANVPEWKNQVLLKKGDTYGARTVYKAWAD